ncbi:group 1 truncated hemoglobin [Pelagibius litoralis]|uniref:Group 1 truncated hemoglobin n=1 Tax=Pelagibius litoralis TaxID=374515 RepID=A0A967F0A9_9PROT|nr:group 1 truncated hemoglobin [Pelagibius litoralis]NIA70702.1 group 1 truncated hemoglobin [Pelagibius litoralis]
MGDTLFDELGGMACLEKVHKIFYGKLLSHPWLKGFFEGVPRWHLESQQSEFMAGVFGGPRIYGGRPPKSAHMHLFITEEVFLIRHDLLRESLAEAGVRPDLMERWLTYDMRMKSALVKESPSDCAGRYNNEAVVVVDKPL